MSPPQTEETWEQEFEWMREKAPSAGEITLHDEFGHDGGGRRRVVTLGGATEEDRARLQQALGLRAPWTRWEVRCV